MPPLAVDRGQLRGRERGRVGQAGGHHERPGAELPPRDPHAQLPQLQRAGQSPELRQAHPRPAAPAPQAATKPTPSWPGTKGNFGFTGQSPSAAWRSVWQTPLATTFTNTWPGPGSGTGTSSMTSGAPKACTTAAFILLAMDLS